MENMEQTKLILYPYKRQDIFLALEDHKAFDAQRNVWVKDKEKGFYLNLKWGIIDPLYNDSDLDIYKEKYIGEIFYDENEARKVHVFCEWFWNLLVAIDEDFIGNNPEIYLEHPEWPKACEGAKKLYELMSENDKKYNFNACLEAFNKTPFEEWEKLFDK